MNNTNIHELDQNIVNKIAAGEVVENYSSVIKELLENSIDAKSNSISIYLENYGSDKIVVVDDGAGMSADDLENSYKYHYTSKINSFEDIYKINTLGFRGEALASIAAVSTIKIKSRTKDSASGREVTISHGDLIANKFVGTEVGTTVEVSEIFSLLPARKKFLKPFRTEYKNILKIIYNYVLSFPEINFALYHNGKLVFNFNNLTDYFSRLSHALGKDVASSLIHININSGQVSITGHISKPQAASYSYDNRFLFVNNRPIESSFINKCIKASYSNLTEKKTFPPYVLNIFIESSLIDINVHPRKEKIKFANENMIEEIISKGIKDTLNSTDLTFKKGIENDFAYNQASEHQMLVLKDSVDSWSLKTKDEENSTFPILQVFLTYLVAPSKEGIILVDQHSAHESILFEEFSQAYTKALNLTEKHQLETPLILTLSHLEMQKFNEVQKLFLESGFEIEGFGDLTVKLFALPKLLKDHNYEKLFKELLEHLYLNKKVKSIDERSRLTLSFLACRTAVKAGEYLTYEERKNLLEKLDLEKNIYTCPHGRPVKVVITKSGLEKLFKRTR